MKEIYSLNSFFLSVISGKVFQSNVYSDISLSHTTLPFSMNLTLKLLECFICSKTISFFLK